MPTSPYYATDLLVRAAAVAPALVVVSGATRNAWHSRERSTAQTAVDAFFAQEVGGSRLHHNDGSLEFAAVQVLTRGSTYAATLARAKQLHDAIDLPASFTANGHVYMLCEADTTGPEHIDFEEGADHEFFVETFRLWYSR